MPFLWIVWIQIYILNGIPWPSNGCNKATNIPNINTTSKHTIFVDNYDRTFYVYIPSNYIHDSKTGSSLVIGIHGFGSSPENIMDLFGMNKHANIHNYIGIYPEGTKFNTSTSNETVTSWNDMACANSPGSMGPTCILPQNNSNIIYDSNSNCFNNNPATWCNWCNCNVNDVHFISVLLDTIEDRYCINKNKEYILGYSNGAMMTQRIGIELNNRITAIVPFHGQSMLGFNNKPRYNDPIPIMNVWGYTDNVVEGEKILSIENLYFTPVWNVMYVFAEHNKCDISNGYNNITTISDGILEWNCVSYNVGCNNSAEARVCGWNGGHDYPLNNGINFGLNVAWNFMNKYEKDYIPEPTPNSNTIRQRILWIPTSIILLFIIIFTIVYFCCSKDAKKENNDDTNFTEMKADTQLLPDINNKKSLSIVPE